MIPFSKGGLFEAGPTPLPAGIQAGNSGGLSSPDQLANDRYRLGDKLGSGNFGSVYLIQDLKTGEKKVLKRINVGEIQPDETIEAVKEATLLSQLNHPAIVKFHDSFVDGEYFCIVTEYCEGGDLDHMIKQLKSINKTLDETLIMDWFVQLTNAIRYIHDRKVLHRDLKTRNIFLKDNKIKLGDFGISRILTGTADYATTFTGTPYYMSPEVLKHEGYNAKSDIWSLGAVLYEMCTGEHAFQGQNLMSIMYKIVEGHPPRLPSHFTPSLKYLHTRMMDKVPSKRPTAIEILQDPYIKRHMESLSQKLALMLMPSTKSNPSEDAKAIAEALKKKHKRTESDQSKPQERAMTPREKMLDRKTKKAEEKAAKMKQIAAQNFSENQKRLKEQKSKKSKRIIPPWVEEHPDVFGDQTISLTAIELSRGHNNTSTKLEDSMMELSIGAPQQQIAAQPHPPSHRYPSSHPSSHLPSHPSHLPSCPLHSPVIVTNTSRDHGHDIPEDPMESDNYYSHFDDFEMDSSSSIDDDEYQQIYNTINEAIDLPAQVDQTALNSKQISSSQVPAPAALVVKVPAPSEVDSHDDFSPFSPLARDRRIAQLKSDAEKIFGREVFSSIYHYLKVARGSEQTDESVVIAHLKRLTDNIRDCFLIDQLVFLEKQAEDSL